MDSQKWSQRGKKLFLPKIEYNRLENSTKYWNTAKLNLDSADDFVVQETIENEDLEQSTSPVADLSDRNGISFPKFSVLPPIQGSKASSKGRPSESSQNRRQLSDAVSSSEEESYYKRKGSSLHRQTAVLAPDRELITIQKTNTDNLKIVGKRYSGLNNTRNQHQAMLTMDGKNRSRTGNLTSRPSTTPNASHPSVCGTKSSRPLSDSENDSGLTYSSEVIPQPDRSDARFSGRRLSKFRRFNSDTSNDGKNESLVEHHVNKNTNHSLLSRANLPQANLLLNPSESYPGSNEKTRFISNCRNPARPISRCHIDINMNESENVNLNLKENRKVLGDTTDFLFDTIPSADVPSSVPLIQISTELNTGTEEGRESQNPPSIQILINSLDSAKEEGHEDEKTEQPKLSVREQRRRSALCRANSKQVDDFLLVHNLRDLGLL